MMTKTAQQNERNIEAEVHAYLAAAERRKTFKLSQEQEAGVIMINDTALRIVGITGRAGTGKTSVLGKAYDELLRKFKKDQIVLCAPTGRAAKRITELTGIPAKTVHRMLEFPMPDDPKSDDDEDNEPAPNRPRRNRNNPLVEKIILVDEASMIGRTLYDQIMEAMPNDACIRFFGDMYQLPPIDDAGGAPFEEILSSDRYSSIELSFNFRSQDDIIANADRILKGSMPIRNARFEIIWSDDPIRELIEFATPEFMQSNHQILTPARKGQYGTDRINPSLQLKFNKHPNFLRLERMDNAHGKDKKTAPILVRPEDKVIWTKNDYALNLFNGEIGQVEWINTEDGSLSLLTPDRAVEIPAYIKQYSRYHQSYISYDPRKQIDLGYAITTHKAQGSEFDTVIYAVSGGSSFLLNRQNFYTAITRARHRVVMICDRKAMSRCLVKARKW